jgi:hypothetical protein
MSLIHIPIKHYKFEQDFFVLHCTRLQERIADLEKEVKGYQVALSLPSNNKVHNLERQAKGTEVAVRINLKSYSDPYVVKLMGRALALRNKDEALQEQVNDKEDYR